MLRLTGIEEEPRSGEVEPRVFIMTFEGAADDSVTCKFRVRMPDKGDDATQLHDARIAVSEAIAKLQTDYRP